MPILCLLLAFPLHAQIYKWVDDKGVVHYGDDPGVPGAKPVKRLPGLSTYEPRQLPETVLEEKKETSKESEQTPQAQYKVLEIISPEEQGTVRSAPGEVPVFVALDPALRQGDVLRVILDGKPWPGKFESTVIKLENVDRGEHQIAVAVYDAKGRLVKQSDSHTFYLHRTIARPQKSPR
jgi:hypothetical protein